MNNPTEVDFFNRNAVIKELLLAGYASNTIKHYLDGLPNAKAHTTDGRIKRIRAMLIEQGIYCKPIKKRYGYKASSLLRRYSAIIAYTAPLLLYCRQHQSTTTDITLLTYCYAVSGKQVDIDALYDLLQTLYTDETFFRQCPHCDMHSLMTTESKLACHTCPFCRKEGITTGKTWYPFLDGEKKAG